MNLTLGRGSEGQAGAAQPTQGSLKLPGVTFSQEGVASGEPRVWDIASAWQAWVCACTRHALSQILKCLRPFPHISNFLTWDKTCPL